MLDKSWKNVSQIKLLQNNWIFDGTTRNLGKKILTLTCTNKLTGKNCKM